MVMGTIRENPSLGQPIERITMTDPRMPATEGWQKMRFNSAGVEVHFTRNARTGEAADFKFVD